MKKDHWRFEALARAKIVRQELEENDKKMEKDNWQEKEGQYNVECIDNQGYRRLVAVMAWNETSAFIKCEMNGYYPINLAFII